MSLVWAAPSRREMAMGDDQQQSGQPPAGAPGSWPPPTPGPGGSSEQPGIGEAPAGAPPGWSQQPQPGWGEPANPQQPQPGWGQPQYQPQAGWGQSPPQQPQPGWGQPPFPPQPQPGWGQPGTVSPYVPPTQGGYPPPPYGQPGGYGPPGYGGTPRYAGFWIRLVAYIIDGLILLAIIIVLAITIIGLLAVIPVGLGYMPYLWWKRGATFGQSALGLRVVRAIDGGPIDGGTACIRALVFWAENFGGYILIGYLGFIWAAFEPRKRAWHDMAAGTVVIHIN